MNCQDMVFPSWNRRGGCASKKKTRNLRSGADGVVIMVNVDVVTLSGTDHPVCAFIRRLRSIFLMAQPPLLSEEGNTLSCNSFTLSYSWGFIRMPSATLGEYERLLNNASSSSVGCCAASPNALLPASGRRIAVQGPAKGLPCSSLSSVDNVANVYDNDRRAIRRR